MVYVDFGATYPDVKGAKTSVGLSLLLKTHICTSMIENL